MGIVDSIKKHKPREYTHALALIFLIILAGYLAINSVLFYLYRYLKIPLPSLNAALYILLQGYDNSVSKVDADTLQFNFAQVLVLAFVVSCIATFFIAIPKKKRMTQIDQRMPSRRLNKIILVSLACLLSAMIMGRRYLMLQHPPGPDTPIYIGEILGLEHSGINQYTLDYFALSGLFYPLTFVGMQAEDIVKIIPIVLTIFAALVTYKFAKDGHFGDKRIPYISAILVPLSLTMILQSAGLYKSLLNYSLVLVSFVLFLRFIKNGDGISLTVVSILLPYMMLFYSIGWLLFVPSALIFVALNYFKNRNKRIIKRTAATLLSSLFLVIAGLWFTPYAIDRYIVTLISSFANVVTIDLISGFLRIQLEQSLLVLLSFIGLLVLTKLGRVHGDEQTQLSAQLLISYCFVISLGFLLTWNYRFLLYMPFPILASIGLSTILQKAERKKNSTSSSAPGRPVVNRRTALTSLVVISLALSLLLSNALYYEDGLTEYTNYPLPGAAACIIWITEHYGSNAVVIVDNVNAESEWIVAIIPPRIYRGDTIYEGTIFGFREGKPSSAAGFPLADPSFFGKVYDNFYQLRLHVFVIDGFWYKVWDINKPVLVSLYTNWVYTVYEVLSPLSQT